MLELKSITKTFVLDKTEKVEALKGIDAVFDENGIVSILGPSGCGKTTLLNIIGGLDRYTSGDLIIDGLSTTKYKDKEWDYYRNHKIGTVFQSYNLIPQLSVLENVEIALTISGISKSQKKHLATESLKRVGLGDKLKAKPNQLSGGQSQRVAIARAIVNNPSIILADEPTGALDSKTSVQVLDLLKSLSEDHLIIMVTHNEELAYKYSNRVIKLFDGEIIDDIKLKEVEKCTEQNKITNDFTMYDPTFASQVKEQLVADKNKKHNIKTSMSLGTAINISGKNLWSKKGRTILTSLAGSIGIVGIALILAVSNGFQNYIDRIQRDTFSQFPVTIDKVTFNTSMLTVEQKKPEAFPSKEIVDIYEPTNVAMHVNNVDQDYLDYLNKFNAEKYLNTINYKYGIKMNVATMNPSNQYVSIDTSPDNSLFSSVIGSTSSIWRELPGDQKFVTSQYDLIGKNSKFPTSKNEILIVVDKYNRITKDTMNGLGYTTSVDSISFDDIIGKEYKIFSNDDFYKVENGPTINHVKSASLCLSNPMQCQMESSPLKKFSPLEGEDLKNLYQSNKGETLKVSGILRINESTTISTLSPGIYFTKELTSLALDYGKDTLLSKSIDQNVSYEIDPATKDFKFVFYDAFTNKIISQNDYLNQRSAYGTDDYIVTIQLFPKDFESKKILTDYLSAYNNDKKLDSEKVIHTDLASTLTDTYGTMINIISYVLIAFSSISLVVSSVMIGIITYISVIERIKEIGILRAIGARKKDVSRLFIAETLIIGAISGTMGVLFSIILCLPINLIINAIVPSDIIVGNIASLNPIAAIVLILISILLTTLSGSIPAHIASKKDPVEALRTE